MCGLLQQAPEPPPGHRTACARCGTGLDARKPDSINRTLAFTSAALILYAPANLLPVMSFEFLGSVQRNTVWDGVTTLARSGMVFIAGVVFLASIVIPLVKIGALFFLSLCAKTGRGNARLNTGLYRAIQVIGPWAMLDVFLLAILVALIKMGQLGDVEPGPGALPFTLVVFLTLLASESFDPKLLWSHEPDAPSGR